MTGSYALQGLAYYRKRIKGSSNRLVRAAWSQYRRYLQGSIDDPSCDDDVISWLESIMSEKVNDSRSRFYIHG